MITFYVSRNRLTTDTVWEVTQQHPEASYFDEWSDDDGDDINAPKMIQTLEKKPTLAQAAQQTILEYQDYVTQELGHAEEGRIPRPPRDD